MVGKQRGVVVAAGIGAGILAALAFSRRGKAEGMPTKKVITRKPSTDQTRAVALAVKYATIFKAPPSLLISIMQIESRNNPNAVNPKAIERGGAWGLTQMTLKTAQDLTKRYPAVAKKYWPKFDGTGRSLLDPETNAAIGAFHLSLLWKRYQGKPGNWLTAGLAWHQGSGNVDKQLAAGKGKMIVSNMTPKGKIYYGWLLNQIEGNPVVAKAVTAEKKAGFSYA